MARARCFTFLCGSVARLNSLVGSWGSCARAGFLGQAHLLHHLAGAARDLRTARDGVHAYCSLAFLCTCHFGIPRSTDLLKSTWNGLDCIGKHRQWPLQVARHAAARRSSDAPIPQLPSDSTDSNGGLRLCPELSGKRICIELLESGIRCFSAL